MEILLKAHIDNNRLRFSIPDKAIRDELKEKIEHNDLLVVELKKIKKKGSLLEDFST